MYHLQQNLFPRVMSHKWKEQCVAIGQEILLWVKDKNNFLKTLWWMMEHGFMDITLQRKNGPYSGNKMPTRCNRGFYCRSYCLLNMFQAPLCPSSGAQEYYTVVAAHGISCCGFEVAGLVCSWELCVRFAGSCFKAAPDTQPSTPHQNSNLKTTARNTTGSNHCIILLSSWWWA